MIGVRYDATELMQGMTEVLAYGTAVVAEPNCSHFVRELLPGRLVIIDRNLVGRNPHDAAIFPRSHRIAEPLVHQQGFADRFANCRIDSVGLGQHLL